MFVLIGEYEINIDKKETIHRYDEDFFIRNIMFILLYIYADSAKFCLYNKNWQKRIHIHPQNVLTK